MIENPILAGFNPDPSILRVGDDYYIATSTFEWFPAVALYHSKDLASWRLLGHALADERTLDLSRLSSAKGVWAPSLTYCTADGLFYLCYSLMYSHNARYFDLDNFVTTAPSIEGPWSDPVQLHSVGFDPSLFHDEDGRSYLVCLQWELRDGDGRPDCIVAQEYDRFSKKLVGELVEIYRGATRRGCLEGPNLYKRDRYYYLLCAEGGTGYGHSVTVARSLSPWGPYEVGAHNPIISAALDFDEADNSEFLKPHRYNPLTELQKTGHGSLVETPDGTWYLAFHCSRPFLPELRCTLGRESALEKLCWTDDGWPTLQGGGTYARQAVEGPTTQKIPLNNSLPACGTSDFSEDPGVHFISPRRDRNLFSSTSKRPGYLRLVGQQSLCSLDTVALVARRLQSLYAEVSTCVEFWPTDWRQSAGLVIYHDHMNYRFLRITWHEATKRRILMLTALTNGARKEVEYGPIDSRVAIVLGLRVQGRSLTFFVEDEEGGQTLLAGTYDLSELSDEFSTYGEFTGTFVGMACEDFRSHDVAADFKWFSYLHTEPGVV